MRVFIAVELNDNIKNELKTVQDKVTPFSKKGRYTDKDNFHLTERFIGDVGAEKIKEIKKVIDYVSRNQRVFDLKLDKLGSFPKKNRHIIWTGLQGELDKLHGLYTKTEETLFEQGYPKEEREYNPHITLGRNVQLGQSIEELKESIQVKPLGFPVKAISLMESVNVNGRLIYRPIHIGEWVK